MDIGGTHVSACVANVATGELVPESRVGAPVESSGDSAAILSQWCAAAKKALKHCEIKSLTGMGLAMPGPFDYEHGISHISGLGKYESLYGLNVRHLLKEGLGLPSVPIIFRNDAQCFLLGENWHGAATGCRNLIGITLGTGFGSAFMRDGVCVENGPGVPKEGWFYLVPFGAGIADDYFSTRGLLRSYRVRGGGSIADARELAGRAGSDQLARVVFEEWGGLLADFLAPYVRESAPEKIVIGGNITRAWELFAPSLTATLDHKCPGVSIVQSALFEDASLLGAARLPLLYKEPAKA
jgi:glucokinase